MKNNTLYLCAPVNALVEGIYEEKIPFTEIKQHGDFGLGTFDYLDGEMIMIDGRIYQITYDGTVKEVHEDALTPFAGVTFFNPVKEVEQDTPLDYAEFLAWLESLMPSPNIFYAFRIEGLFSAVKARSVPRSECYKPLAEVAQDQRVFDFSDVEGTLAGFYTPNFMSSLSVPGFHLHFLSEDHTQGGHLLSCRTEQIKLSIQYIYNLELGLPKSEAYLHLDFQRDVEKDLDKVEN